MTTSPLMPTTAANSRPLLHVAVGVVSDSTGRVLIALRSAKQHQGNLWEFPGGKVELGETCHEALQRELKEELGVDILASEPLIQIEHHYDDKSVLLDVRRVLAYSGEPVGQEGQPIRWVQARDLYNYDFPKANKPIVAAVNLPELMVVTGNFDGDDDLEARLAASIDLGARLVFLRSKAALVVNWRNWVNLIERLYPDVRVVVSSDVGNSLWTAAPGVHLTSQHLMAQTVRPISTSALLGASCHNEREVLQANLIGADYITISPVLPTASHPERESLGWAKFALLVRLAKCPVYALGGLAPSDLQLAKSYGAQGIAGLGCFWERAREK